MHNGKLYQAQMNHGKILWNARAIKPYKSNKTQTRVYINAHVAYKTSLNTLNDWNCISWKTGGFMATVPDPTANGKQSNVKLPGLQSARSF